MSPEQIEILQRRLKREKAARLAAETLLESKSRELFSANEQLKRSNEQLEIRVKLRTEELKRARDAAWESSRAKSEFLANMSHELRTPLNAIIGFASMMSGEMLGTLNERYREYSGNIQTSGEHLLDLINAILDLAKIEAGRLELEEKELKVKPILDVCGSLMTPKLEHDGLRIEQSVEDPEMSVRADETKLRQMVLNLLSNAVKFSEEGGVIVIRTFTSDTGCPTIEIRDQGIGMTQQEVDQAIRPFVQVSGDHDMDLEGTGLGLSLTKKLAQLHDGRLLLRSEKGVGTRVSIELPNSRLVETGEKMAVHAH